MKRVSKTMQQVRCDLCGRLVTVEANQPSTCPSCGFALHVPEPVAETQPPRALVPGPGVDVMPAPHHEAVSAAPEVAPEVTQDAPLTLGPFVADPAPLAPPPPLPTPPAPEVAAGIPVAAAAAVFAEPMAEAFPPAFQAPANASEPYADMVAIPAWEPPTEILSSPAAPTTPLMPPADAPALELLPAPLPPMLPPLEANDAPLASAVEPAPAFDTGAPGAEAPSGDTGAATAQAGPLMPSAETAAPSAPQVPEALAAETPLDHVPHEMEPDAPTQIAEVIAPAPAPAPYEVVPNAPAYGAGEAPAQPVGLTAPESAPDEDAPPFAAAPMEPEPITQAMEPAPAIVPPSAPVSPSVPPSLPAGAPSSAPVPPAGYPYYPQSLPYAPQSGMPPYAQTQQPVSAGNVMGYPVPATDPRTMPAPPYVPAPPSLPLATGAMPPQMGGQYAGVPYPSAYPGIPMVQPQPPRRRVNPLLIVVIVLVLLALVAAGAALALSHGSGNGNSGSQVSATPTLAATATSAVPAGFTVFKDQGAVYTIIVPSAWTQTKTASGDTSISLFTSTQQEAVFEIVTLPATNSNPTSILDGFFTGVSGGQPVLNKSAQSYQQQGGETWTQESADTTVGNQPAHVVVLIAQHGTTSVLVAYFAPSANFASVNTQDFQPMFTSFQFLA